MQKTELYICQTCYLPIQWGLHKRISLSCHGLMTVRSFLLCCSAARSSLLPGLKSCYAQENKVGVRNSQCRNLHTGGVQLLCLFFSRANTIGEELQSLCIFLCEEFKAGKQVLFSKADCGVTQFYCKPVYPSVCFLTQCGHSLPSQSS